MKQWVAPSAVLAIAALVSGCGGGSPVFTPGTTPPVYSPVAGGSSSAQASTTPTATGSGSPTASAGPTQTPDPPAPNPAFATPAGAHDYAAQRGAAHFNATLVKDSKNCPSAEGAACYVESTQSVSGDHAMYFLDSIGFNPTGAADIAYLYQDGSGWHWMDSLGTQMLFPSKETQIVQVDSGCANVHSGASTQSGVVACLKAGTQITVDDGPTYADGHIWWHVQEQHGWIAHDNLIAGFAPQTQT